MAISRKLWAIIAVVGDELVVRFRPPADLRPTQLEDRVVECLLY